VRARSVGVLAGAAQRRVDRQQRGAQALAPPTDGGEMSSVGAGSAGEADTASVKAGDFSLEVVVLPVSDVERAKQFYGSLGWRLDADVSRGEDFRLVQFTPPGSGCSVQFGTNIASGAPGSAQSLYLAVLDIEAARKELLARGVEVGDVFHEGAPGARFHDSGRVPGPAPDRGTYGSFAAFSDPDGNGWLLQEITTRLPGR
jgi:catechol 2,3-dioxygenase-like lactoylglutathione lyase family enzyme